MSYTLSFDASLKVKSVSECKKLFHHTGRDVDARAGIQRTHANGMIDAGRTKRNLTAVYDATTGKYKRCTDLSQIADALTHRLGDVTGRKVKNPVIMRGIVLQLDSRWYEGKSKEECEKAARTMLNWAGKTFGKANIVCYSRHLDESHEHLHLGVCPVTADGRLSQKDWFGSPRQLRELHDDFRRHMQAAGYDVTMERKTPGKHTKRLSEAEYKRKAEQDRREAEQDRREEALAAREAEFQELTRRSLEAERKRKIEQDRREVLLEARKGALAAREAKCEELTRQALEALKMAHTKLQARYRDTSDIDRAYADLCHASKTDRGLSL